MVYKVIQTIWNHNAKCIRTRVTYGSGYAYYDTEDIYASFTTAEFDLEVGVEAYEEATIQARSVIASARREEKPPAPVVIGDVRLESEFRPNVLFHTEIAEEGKLSIEFDTPINLGTFVVRALAASNESVFGSAETEVVIRRDISVTPSVPRFVRVNDDFDAGIVVTITGSPKEKITVSVDTEGPLLVIGRHEITVRTGQDKQESVRFQFRAQKLGNATLTFTAVDKHGNRDGVQVSLPIEGPQESVVVATSFVLAASDTRSGTSQEGLDLPEAVPGSGTIEMTAGVGQQPAVLSLAEQLIKRDPDVTCPYTGGYLLSITLIPAIINPYSPWGEASGQEALTKMVIDAFQVAADLISVGKDKMTRSYLGLLHYLPCPQHRSQFTPSPTLRDNTEAVWLFDQVQDQYTDHPVKIVRQKIEDLETARKVWGKAAERLCVEEAKDSRKKLEFPLDLDSVARCRAALGTSWEPGPNVPDQIRKDLSMSRLENSFSRMGLEAQALYILTRLKATPEHPDIAKAVREWTGLYRVTGRTAYISAYEGAATPASILANALILMAMTRAGESGQLLPKLATYVAAPVGDYYGFSYFGNYDMAVAMTALVVYDDSRNNTQPDIDFEAFSGDVTLLEVSPANAYISSCILTLSAGNFR